jgi:hypothetical protein
MRLLKVLVLSALLGSGAAFASEDWTEQKPEQIPDQYALQDGDVIYLYPVEESREAPG